MEGANKLGSILGFSSIMLNGVTFDTTDMSLFHNSTTTYTLGTHMLLHAGFMLESLPHCKRRLEGMSKLTVSHTVLVIMFGI